MSALGQKQTSRRVLPMSALPPKADIAKCDHHVRFVPKADIAATLRYVDHSAPIGFLSLPQEKPADREELS